MEEGGSNGALFEEEAYEAEDEEEEGAEAAAIDEEKDPVGKLLQQTGWANEVDVYDIWALRGSIRDEEVVVPVVPVALLDDGSPLTSEMIIAVPAAAWGQRLAQRRLPKDEVVKFSAFKVGAAVFDGSDGQGAAVAEDLPKVSVVLVRAKPVILSRVRLLGAEEEEYSLTFVDGHGGWVR